MRQVEGEAAYTVVLCNGLLQNFDLYELKADDDPVSDDDAAAQPRLDLTRLASQGTSSTSLTAEQRRIEFLEQKMWIVETKLIDVVTKLNDIETQFIDVETAFEEVERKMRITDLKFDRLEREQESLSRRVDDRLEETVKVQAEAIIVLERSINILLNLHSMD